MSAVAPELDAFRLEKLKTADFLVSASDAIGELLSRTESIAHSGNLEILGFSRQHLGSLTDVLIRGSRVLERRIAELEGDSHARSTVSHKRAYSRNAIVEPITFFASYRACCRSLCLAMKQAMGKSDSTSVLILREIVLHLEKELWMIDAPERKWGADESRAVALFLSC